MQIELGRGGEALALLLQYPGVSTVLDVGSGQGEHAAILRESGRDVTTISLAPGADYVGDFMGWPSDKCDYDAVWACHVLEHQPNPGEFLRECRRRLRPGGLLAVTVPPLKHEIVGGHVTLWNAGLLLYQLILAGFDCRNARVGTYGYNISVIVPNEPIDLPELTCDEGDIERLAQFFPVPVAQGFDGELRNVNWEGENPVPRHVAIVGMGPSAEQFMDYSKRMGGRSALCDEVWVINGLGDVLACDLVFHMDDVRIQEIRSEAAPDSNIANMLKWMRKHRGPIMTSRAHPDYPSLVEFPLADVLNKYPMGYFNGTAAYAVAYAMFIGVKKISMYGCDFTYPDAHDAEKGRACVEFWLGMAAAAGIELAMPKNTSLMDALEPQAKRFYGYDTLDLAITHDGQRINIDFTERDSLPTAEQIEHEYDHSRHPNPLTEAVK